MGNCVVVGLGEANKVIRVITSNGGVVKFSTPITSGSITDTTSDNRRPRQVHQARTNSVPASLVVPYRMTQPTLKRSHTDVFYRYKYNHHHPGVFKVKLVITTEHLLEILSQEARIEGVRTVA
ncbi:hypothetical protein F3Y22_tig00111837pilonHSYRG00525 [Hibiscus syriacus]|uniref:Uncharacterized protein n=1 Tax=Hibiscus syriacus TaxID=106335 RepID=A0A6A2YED9_HIBSY|nr:hypothetical protein F3Y22_tig00111837pilonHSYRG00525 [Hibiscus syriacus]